VRKFPAGRHLYRPFTLDPQVRAEAGNVPLVGEYLSETSSTGVQ